MIKKSLAFTSTILWILLPKCSLCLYAYLGIFSALGLGNLVNSKYSVFFIAVFLSVNFIVMLIMLLKEKEYPYALTSFFGAIILVCNKMFFHNNVYLNILVTCILLTALLRVRLLNIVSKKCTFYGHVR